MKKKIENHLFICTNKPTETGHCGSKNSEQLRQNLKTRCSKETWGKNTRINSAGCLGHCEHGIAAVLYPEGKWFFDLAENDSEELFQAVKTAAEKHK